MGRGFFAGTFWGGVIGAVVIALTSQLADWRDLTPPLAPGGGQVSALEAGQPGAAPAEVAPEAGLARAPAAGLGALPTPGDAAPVETAPPAVPQAAEVAQAPQVPAPVQAGATEMAQVAPVVPIEQPAAAAPPPSEGALALAEDAPARPEAADVAILETPETVSPRAPLPAPEAPAARVVPLVPAPVLPTSDTPATGGSAPVARTQTDGAPMGNLAQNVRVNRLPRIGDPVVEDVPQEAVPQGALALNAVAFEAAGDAPLMAVILIHAGALPDPAMLEALPMPVSFAVDAADPEAAAIARTYRAAGHEVVLIPDLPEGALASDVEVALAVTLQVVPQAVALMDDPAQSFQTEREAVAQVIAAAAASGHGVVAQARGFSPALQLAGRAEVPNVGVFRQIEGDAAAHLRLLDQVAFRARQDGAAVALGRVEVLPSVLAWALSPQGAAVTLAPISALLRR